MPSTGNDPGDAGSNSEIKVFQKDEDMILVSLGTGQLTRSITYDESRDWGLVEWARPLLSVVFDGVSGTVEYQLKQLLNNDDSLKKYFRFQTKLDIGNDNMDDATSTNLRALKLKAEQMIKDNSEDIDKLCKLLN